MPADADGEWVLSDHAKEHIGDILAGEGTWFGAHVLRLIDKADADNRERIRKGFPKIVEAYEEWFRGEPDG